MNYVRFVNNNFEFLSGLNVEWDETHYCAPDRLTEDEQIFFGVYPLTPSESPTFNPLTQRVIETDPILAGRVATQQWQVETLTTEVTLAYTSAARNLKWNQIKAERDNRKSGGTFVSNKWFHSDSDSRIQQLGLVLMGANVPVVQWKTMDGTLITMTQALAGGIFQATATLDMQLFEVAEGHRLAMEASERPDLYDFSAGWPARYSE